MNLSTLVIMAVVMISSTAFAGKLDGESWNANLNYFIRTVKVDESKASVSFMDITAGYTRSKGLYLGGIYGTGSGDIKMSHMGPSIGYLRNGWNFMAHYLLGGEYTGGGTEYEEGTGTQIDVGRVFKTDLPIFVGVQITSRSMSYKPSSGGANVKIDDTYPAIKFAYYW